MEKGRENKRSAVSGFRFSVLVRWQADKIPSRAGHPIKIPRLHLRNCTILGDKNLIKAPISCSIQRRRGLTYSTSWRRCVDNAGTGGGDSGGGVRALGGEGRGRDGWDGLGEGLSEGLAEGGCDVAAVGEGAVAVVLVAGCGECGVEGGEEEEEEGGEVVEADHCDVLMEVIRL